MSTTTTTANSISPSGTATSKPTVLALALSPTHTFSKTLLPSLTLLPGLGIQGDCHCGPTVQHRSRLHIRPAPANLRQVHLIHSELFDEVGPQPTTPASAAPTREWRGLPILAVQVLGATTALGAVGLVGAIAGFEYGTWSVNGAWFLAVLGAMWMWSKSPVVLRWLLGRTPSSERGAALVEAGQGHAVRPGDLGENVTTRGIDLLSLPADTLLRFVNPEGDGKDRLKVEERPTIRITGLRNPCPQIDGFSKGLRERCLMRDEEREVVGRRAGVMSVVVVGGEVKVGAEIEVTVPKGERRELVCV